MLGNFYFGSDVLSPLLSGHFPEVDLSLLVTPRAYQCSQWVVK